MDSKLRRTAILSSLFAILIVTGVVFWANRDTAGKPKKPTKAPSAAETGEKEPDVYQKGQIGNDLKAFERDEHFFDKETNSVLDAAKDDSNRLSLVVTSVEKDLRIQIVDIDGNLVTGSSFYVELAGEDASVPESDGKYKDLDQDGVIYIGDLRSGDYSVALAPVEGFKVPTSKTRVKVKDKVEYLPIEDISLLIKTEDEVDAGAEDSRTGPGEEDVDKTEATELKAFTGRTKSGIDVSKWNGEIDWDKVKDFGIQFAVVRAGYRGSVTGSLVKDIRFEENMKGAKEAGIPVGIYFFTQATNEVEAVEEASAVLKWIADHEITYPVYIDTEGAGGNGRADGLDADTRTLVCEAFCRTVENAGYKAGVYASRSWYNNNLHAQKLENYSIWLAEYRSAPLYQGYYNMWQYSSKGSIDGIAGNVDMNVMYE